MALIPVQVSVEDKAYDIMVKLRALIAALRSGTPVLTEVLVLIAQLGTLVNDFQALPAEVKESLVGVVNAGAIGGINILADLTGKS